MSIFIKGLNISISAVLIIQLSFSVMPQAFAGGDNSAPPQVSTPAQNTALTKNSNAQAAAVQKPEKNIPGNAADTINFLQNNTLAPATVSAVSKNLPDPAPVNPVIAAFKDLVGTKKYTPKTQDLGELGLNAGLVKTIGTLSDDGKTLTVDFYTEFFPDDSDNPDSVEIFSTRMIINGSTAVMYDICSADYQGVDRKSYSIATLTGIKPSTPRGFEATLVTQGYGSASGEYSKKITGDNFYELMINTSMRELNNYFSLDYHVPLIAEQYGLDLPVGKWQAMTPLYDHEGTVFAIKISIEGVYVFFQFTWDLEGNRTIEAISDLNKNGRLDQSDIKQTRDYLNSITPFLPAVTDKSPAEVRKTIIVLRNETFYFEGAKVGLAVRGIIAYLMINNRAYLLINIGGKLSKYPLPGYIWPWLFPKSLLTI